MAKARNATIDLPASKAVIDPGTKADSKAERAAKAVADSVGAGRIVQVDTVDFSDPDRPKTCLEVDFPVLLVNQVAAIEGNVIKPIYQISKWFARRRSSVFRAILLAAATKAPDDDAEAAKLVWDIYYDNHQQNSGFAKLKVVDPFMGGGTTIVEGARLGMQMFGNDLNPVAWFIVKTELADVSKAEVEALLADVEAEVKPQMMPFYACNGPHGERGTWTRLVDGKVMGDDFEPWSVEPERRKEYRYDGPEIVYAFWCKHGPCQTFDCGHRTPLLASPVVAVKELSVKAWPHKCPHCGLQYDIEESEVRMAPDEMLVMSEGEKPFAVADAEGAVVCPGCGETERVNLGGLKATRKKVSLTLLVHPDWMRGEQSTDRNGEPFGGSAVDSAESTSRWFEARAKTIRLIEVRGSLPRDITMPDDGGKCSTSVGTMPKTAYFACGRCGVMHGVLSAVEASGTTAMVAPYAVQCFSARRERCGKPYGGRFFVSTNDARSVSAATREWDSRKDSDLASYWPRNELPDASTMCVNNRAVPNHGFSHWWKLFNPRQLLGNAVLLKAIETTGDGKYRRDVREFVLAAFQNYIRNQSMFSSWDLSRDHISPAFGHGHFHTKSLSVEVGVFPPLGRGPWSSTIRSLLSAVEWRADPWDILKNDGCLPRRAAQSDHKDSTNKSVKVYPKDSPLPVAQVECVSATDLPHIDSASCDLVITDPPFGGLVNYAELSDFFYAWLRLVLKDQYPAYFTPEQTPKTLEVVSNRARRPDDADAYYEQLLTMSWRESNRILKSGGLLVFTFHHADDAPWLSVLESVFEAGFYLTAAYPIRSDETKGEGKGAFGAQKIEFDIIHVCRKRIEDPKRISWSRMREYVLADLTSIRSILEHHRNQGLPEADLHVIRRGKVLEFYSKHYGKVYLDDGRPMTVRDALLGGNQILEEEAENIKDPPPVSADPMTRQFLRLFDGEVAIARDQVQKLLRGTGVAPSDYMELGWCEEERKIYRLTSFAKFAKDWYKDRHPRQLLRDYDQARFLIGACFPFSGINVMDELGKEIIRPQKVLDSLILWLSTHGGTSEIREAARVAHGILASFLTERMMSGVTFDMRLGD